MNVACNRKQRGKKTNQRYGKVKREEGKMRRGGGQRGKDSPSSFFRTRSTAPEQPLQLMVTLNVYVWSSDMVARGRLCDFLSRY